MTRITTCMAKTWERPGHGGLLEQAKRRAYEAHLRKPQVRAGMLGGRVAALTHPGATRPRAGNRFIATAQHAALPAQGGAGKSTPRKGKRNPAGNSESVPELTG
jgi:hypothetical protein